jgi:hypothetical protein
MRVLSWNVDGTFPPQGSPDGIDDQIEWLASLEQRPVLLLLQGFNHNHLDHWRESLRDRLGSEVVGSEDVQSPVFEIGWIHCVRLAAWSIERL